MPLVQDRAVDVLTSSPTRYHCATDAPDFKLMIVLNSIIVQWEIPFNECVWFYQSNTSCK